MILHTSPTHLNDSPEITRILNNPRITENLNPHIPYPYTLEDAHEWCTNVLPGALIHTAVRTENGKFIGAASIQLQNGKPTLGYYLDQDYWGRGIMSKHAQLVMKQASEMGLRKVYTHVRQGNSGSRKILERIGFKLVGTGKEMYGNKGLEHEAWFFEWTQQEL